MISLASLFVVLVGLVIVENIQAAVTLQQMLDAGKLMRQSCQPKFKISNEIADGIRDGNIPDTKDVKCYINCILELTKSVKRGKYQLDVGLKQIELLVPDDMKDDYRKAMINCKDAAAGNNSKNNCEMSYEILKCFYKNNPRFVFP